MKLSMTDAAPWMAEASKAAAIINTTMYEVEYPDIQLAGLIPINTNFPEWAIHHASGITDKTGRAKWQSTFAKDVPLADVTVSYEMGQFAEYAVGYQFNNGELGVSGLVGYNLTERKAASARYAADLFVYETGLIGSQEKGFGGLLNHPQAFTAPASKPWVLNTGVGNATPEEIVTDVNFLLLGPQNGATGVITNLLADTLMLPPAAYSYIATTAYGVSAPGKTILQVLAASNVFTQRTGRALTIREMPWLTNAATVGIVGGGRAVAYNNSAYALELPMAMPFRFFPVWQDGPFNFAVPGMGRIGGLDLKRPALRYLDGVTQVPTALAALTIGTDTATSGTPWTSTITGETTGSVISASSSDGTAITVTGGNAGLSATFTGAGDRTVTLVERLGWETHSSQVTVTVS
jgi:hypothetical protein